MPGSGDNALFAGTFGNSGIVTLTGTGSFTANVSTITINSNTNQGTDFNAGSSAASVATLNFGSGTSGLTYSFGTLVTNTPNFYIGRNRATTGTIVTSIGGLLDFKTRYGQSLFLESTIVGAGSISIGSITGSYGSAPLGCGLILGGSSQLADGTLDTNNTFSGGVTLEGFGLLGLGESSKTDPIDGHIISGPIGTGTLTIHGGRIAAFRGGTLSTVGGTPITLDNHIVATGAITTLGNTDQIWTNSISLNNSSGSTEFNVSLVGNSHL